MSLRRRTYLALLILWVTFTFILTSIPNPKLPIRMLTSDKAAHFVFYGVMGFLCAMWRRESGRGIHAAILSGILFAVLAGAVDEVHQYWIPGRSMDLFDWIADTAGGATGALFSSFLPNLFPYLMTE